MIDFILYEDDWEANELIKMTILKFLGCRQEKFKIYDYKNYDACSDNYKIYIISCHNFKKNVRIAKNIRNSGDWDSQIIFVNDNVEVIFHNKLLVLDNIVADSNMTERLKWALFTAYKILSFKKHFCFMKDGEIYCIPYKDILYIEKGNNQNFSTIYTTSNSFVVNDTINNLEEVLDENCFMKIHRSCIVNIFKIKRFKYNENIIEFEGASINYISREKKVILKNRLLRNKVMS